jgi:hypothetical protein
MVGFNFVSFRLCIHTSTILHEAQLEYHRFSKNTEFILQREQLHCTKLESK